MKAAERFSVVVLGLDDKALGRQKYSLYLWEIPTGKKVRMLERSKEYYQLRFSGDGNELVVLESPRENQLNGPILRRLETATGKKLLEVRLPFDQEQDGNMVFSFSNDGRLLFVGSGISLNWHRLEIWDAVSGKKLRSLNPRRP